MIIIGANSGYHYACAIIVGVNSRKRAYLAAAPQQKWLCQPAAASVTLLRLALVRTQIIRQQRMHFRSAHSGTKTSCTSCRAEWFQSWPRLHYEEDKDTVLCHVCARADSQGKLRSGTAEPSFVSVIMYCYKVYMYTCIEKTTGQIYTA